MLSSRRASTLHAARPATASAELEADRLSFIDAALAALPGVALRQYFAPVMRLRRNMLRRQRHSRQRLSDDTTSSATRQRRIADGLQALAKAIAEAAAGELGQAAPPLDAEAFVALLRDKAELISFEPHGVLCYPNELPETLFVYVLLGGSVSRTNYEPLPGRAGATAAEHKLYFTSCQELIRLAGAGPGGGGLAGGNGGAAAAPMAGNDATSTAGNARDTAPLSPGNDAAADKMSSSIATTTATGATRAARRAWRQFGLPTLQACGTGETIRAPAVLGAAEALSMRPWPCASCCAAVTAATRADGVQYEAFTDALRVRARDVHEALVQLALRERGGAHGTCGQASAAGSAAQASCRNKETCAATGAETVTLAGALIAARTKALTMYYPLNDILLRQSWLLQDTPLATIRTLLHHLTPRVYLPGDTIAEAHVHAAEARQLCFLRRGCIDVMEADGHGAARLANATASATTTGNEAAKEAHERGDDADEAAGRWPDAVTAGQEAGAALYGAANNSSMCAAPNSQAACGRVSCAIEAGASYGELSVLFGEPRAHTLRARTVCEVWCLPHHHFTYTVRRDNVLCRALVEKAGALRIKWLAEQRYAPALAARLRASAELFRAMPPMVLRLVQDRLEPVVYSPGALLASTSRQCTEMLLVTQGRVVSLCDGVASYGPGAVLGESCLLAHRWPFALVARTMVEGWSLRRSDLLAALKAADFLHAHSAEVTSQAALYMKQLYAAPVPEPETDAVGRQRMPRVAPAPSCGGSYPAFARHLAELQLRAFCRLHRDLVRWEDISYASTTRSAPTRHAVAGGREQAERPLSAASAGAARKGCEAAAADMSGTSHSANSSCVTEQASGKQARSATPRNTKAAAMPSSTLRRQSTLASAFLVNPEIMPRPFARPDQCAAGNERQPRGRRREQRVQHASHTSSSSATRIAQPSGGDEPSRTRASQGHGSLCAMGALPPRLRRFARTLEERDRLYAIEQSEQSNAAAPTQAHSKTSSEAHMGAGPAASLRGAHAPLACATAGTSGQPGGLVLAPVHLFLTPERLRGELTVMEAIGIGYVLQLPDTQHIQACVSAVDPDITVGLPTHRARRWLMARTPNARFHKLNFLFAAAVFDDASELDEEQRARAQAEQAQRGRTEKLMTLMKASVVTEWHERQHRHLRRTARRRNTGSTPSLRGEELDRSADSARSAGSSDDGSSSRSDASAVDDDDDDRSIVRGGEGTAGAASHNRPVPGGETAAATAAAAAVTTTKSMSVGGESPGMTNRSASDASSSLFALERLRSEALDSLQLVLRSAPSRTLSVDELHGRAEAAPLFTTVTPPTPTLSPPQPSLPECAQTRTLLAVNKHEASDRPEDAPHAVDVALQEHTSSEDRPTTFADAFATPAALPAQVPQLGLSFVSASGLPFAHPPLAPTSTASSAVSPQARHRASQSQSLYAGPAAGALSRRRRASSSVAGRRPPMHRHTCTPPHNSGNSGAVEALCPDDFVIPDPEQSEAMMRRMQHDIDGINAATLATARARAQARERARRLGPRAAAAFGDDAHATAASSSSSGPTHRERELLQRWQTRCAEALRDPLQAVLIPRELAPQAGPDYLAAEVRARNAAALAALRQSSEETTRVTTWRQHLSSAAASTTNAAGAATIAAVGEQLAPRVETAVFGAAQLGYTNADLTLPALVQSAGRTKESVSGAHDSDGARARWARQREELFRAYRRLQQEQTAA